MSDTIPPVLKSNVFYLLEMKEWSNGKFEASLNIGDGKVVMEADSLPSAIAAVTQEALDRYRYVGDPQKA